MTKICSDEHWRNIRVNPMLHLAVVVIVLAGCGSASLARETVSRGKANPWSAADFNNDAENFQFAIVADRTGNMRKGVFSSAIEKINLLRPEFVIGVGDFIEGYTDDAAELDRQWGEFDEILNKLDMRFFFVPGNHDIAGGLMLEKWRSRFGDSYYHFLYRGVLFLCLDTETARTDGAPGAIGAAQVEYFRTVLEANPSPRWILVFMHRPLWKDRDEDFAKFEKLLAGRRYTVFAGHEHRYQKQLRGGQKYFTLATTGGASLMSGPEEGFFDHFVWVTMSEKGPVIVNIAVDCVYSEDVGFSAKNLESHLHFQHFACDCRFDKAVRLDKPL